MKEGEGKEVGASIHPVQGISRRNQFLIWLSGWQSWRTSSATMDLITQNCPREREDERQRELQRGDGRGGPSEEDKQEGRRREREKRQQQGHCLGVRWRGGGCSRETDGDVQKKRRRIYGRKTRGLKSTETRFHSPPP